MLGPILSAVGSLASTFLGNRQAKEANALARETADRNIALQREFAEHGISYRVADAKRSGIHPLYALGANTTSFAPVSVGSASTDFSGLGKAGQDIGRAIDATRSSSDRQGALQTSIAAAQLDGLRIDNDIKRAELASKIATNATRGPAMPFDQNKALWEGQGDAIKLNKPSIKTETRRDVAEPGNLPYVAGSGPGTAVYRNTTGGFSPVIPPELAESLESDWAGALDWMIRNRVVPNFTAGQPPSIPHGKDEEVFYNVYRQQWQVRKKGERYEKGFRFPPWSKKRFF